MIRIEHGDCLDVMPTLGEVDSIVTDPPYHLTSIVKRFGAENAAPAKVGKTGAYARASSGFMGKQWDGGDVAFRPETWRLAFDVLKPGGYLIAFGGTRTYHRLACAIEDAGFEIRDQLQWLFGSGFPKSHDVSKAIDKAAGAEREVVGPKAGLHSRGKHRMADGWRRPWMDDPNAVERGMMATAPTTDAAKQWDGWGTALKPACEPIVLARKPLSGKSIAANVLKHGTGAVNVDGCRVGTDDILSDSGSPPLKHGGQNHMPFHDTAEPRGVTQNPAGRWPANVVHDGSDEVLEAFAAYGERPACMSPSSATPEGQILGGARSQGNLPMDSGTAARFFYSAKADATDRLGSKHPTVKPVDLMRWLVRLITPPGGTVLDPFAGTGTTGMACMAESFNAILIEREAEYVADIKNRIKHVSGHNTPLFAEVS